MREQNDSFELRCYAFCVVALLFFIAWLLFGCSGKRVKADAPTTVTFRDCRVTASADGKISCQCDHIVWITDIKQPERKIAQCANKENE